MYGPEEAKACNQAAAPPTKSGKAQSQPQATEGIMVAIEALCQSMNRMEDHIGEATPPTASEPSTTVIAEQGPQGGQTRKETNNDPVLSLLKELAGRMASLVSKLAQPASATAQPVALTTMVPATAVAVTAAQDMGKVYSAGPDWPASPAWQADAWICCVWCPGPGVARILAGLQ